MWFLTSDPKKRHRKELKKLIKRISKIDNRKDNEELGSQLMMIRDDDTWVNEPMIRLFSSGSSDKKYYISDSIVKILILFNDKRVIDMLIAELLSQNDDKSIAVKILGKAKCKVALDPILTTMLSCSEKGLFLLGNCAQALADIGCIDDRIDTAVRHALQIAYEFGSNTDNGVKQIIYCAGKIGGSKSLNPLCSLYAKASYKWDSLDWRTESKVFQAFTEIEDRLSKQVMVKLLVDELHKGKSEDNRDLTIGAVILLNKICWEPETEEDKSLLKTQLEKQISEQERAEGYRNSAG